MEIHHNGEWGTVCDSGWDLKDAEVMCSELQFGPPIAARSSAFYGQGSGKIWLDNVNCIGTENTIGNCSHKGWGIKNCSHSQDVSVQCNPGNTVLM